METLEKLDELFAKNRKNQINNIYVDKVTNLLNIVAFEKIFNSIVTGSYNDFMLSCKDYSIIVCDLNYLKNINDQFGHLEGNKALKQVSKIMLSCVQKDDFLKKYDLGKQNNKPVFRIGGDEFLIVLRNSNKKETIKIANKIRNKTNAYNNKKFFLSIAVGVASVEDVKINKRNIKKALFKMFETADKDMFQDKINIKSNLSSNKKETIIYEYIKKIYDLLQLNINNESDLNKFNLVVKKVINKTVTK